MWRRIDFLEKRGLDVELIPAAHGSTIIAGVVSGSVSGGDAYANRIFAAAEGFLETEWHLQRQMRFLNDQIRVTL